MQQFESAIGTIAWEANDATLTIEMAGRTHLLAWNEMRGAGTVMLPMGDAADAPKGRHLVISPGANATYLLRIPLPTDEETESLQANTDSASATALLDLLKDRLGLRWYTDLRPNTYRSILIPRWSNMPEWVMPAAVLGFIGLSAIFLLFCMLATMVRTEGWHVVWWQVGMGLFTWLIVVGAILGIYRRIWMK